MTFGFKLVGGGLWVQIGGFKLLTREFKFLCNYKLLVIWWLYINLYRLFKCMCIQVDWLLLIVTVKSLNELAPLTPKL